MAEQIVLNFDSKYCNKCARWLPVTSFPLRKKRGKTVRRSRCKTCENQASLDNYYQQDKQRLAARMRKYRKANPRMIAAIQRRNYEKHRKCRTEAAKQYYRIRRTERLRYSLQYRRANAAAIREGQQRYYRDHKSTFFLAALKRRAAFLKAPGGFSFSEWLSKCDFWGWRCYICKCQLTQTTVSLEHRKPLSRGGSNWLANLAPACITCNLSKGDKTEAEFRRYLGTIAVV